MTEQMSVLFEGARVGDLDLPNRVLMAPMTRARANGATPSPLMGTYYEQRASAGLIISEGVVISPEATGFVNVPGIYSDEQVAAWQFVTEKVHGRGGRIFAQLWHVGPISHPDLLGGKLPLAPSAINPNWQAFTKTGPTDTVTPKAMTAEDIDRTISDFRRAALNAIAAGFDGIELHAANAYLIHQFLAPSSNRRTDNYGGSRENRSRFLFEVVEAVSSAIGNKRTAVRLNPIVDGVAGIVLDDELEKTFQYVVNKLSDFNLAFLELAALTLKPGFDSVERTIEMARHYRPLYRGNLVVNGSMTEALAEAALAGRLADFIAFGRPFIANPDLVRRFRQGIPLTVPRQETFYEGGETGYIDYPFAGPAQ